VCAQSVEGEGVLREEEVCVQSVEGGGLLKEGEFSQGVEGGGVHPHYHDFSYDYTLHPYNSVPPLRRIYL